MINSLHTLAILGAILVIAVFWFLLTASDDSSDVKKKGPKRVKKAKVPPPLTFQDFGIEPRENKSSKKSQSTCKITTFPKNEAQDQELNKEDEEVGGSLKTKGTTSETVPDAKDEAMLEKAKSERAAMQKKWSSMTAKDKQKIIDRISSLEGTILKLEAAIKDLKIKEREKMFEKNRFATADLLLAEELSDHGEAGEEQKLQDVINKAHQLEKVQALEAMANFKRGMMDEMLGRRLKISNAQVQVDLNNAKNSGTAQQEQERNFDERMAAMLANEADKSSGKWTTVKASKRLVKKQDCNTPAYSVESIPTVTENTSLEKTPSSNRRGGAQKKPKNKQPVKTIPGLNYVK